MTIRVIARLSGLSKSAVSLALNGHPRISAKVTRKVQALAKKLNYKPDPTVAKVMSAIARRNSTTVTAPIVLLSDWPTAKHWLNPKEGLRRFYRGIVERTGQLGYRVEEIWLRAPGMSPKRIEQILAARGIEGVIVFNYPMAPAKLAISLSQYASVVIGRALVYPRLYAVDHDHHQGLFECLRNVSARGYTRPGLLLSIDAHERTMHCWAAAYQFFLSQLPRANRIPSLIAGKVDAFKIRKWVRAHRPDVVIAADFSTLELLLAAGYHVPRDFGFAVLFWREENVDAAGIDTQDEAQAARAVDLLVEQIRHNQHGIPHKPETILFDGNWRNGPSLPSK